MVKLKLTLKSRRPSTIYAANGKHYKLQPGSNTLELEYEDYLAVAKSLGITPIEDKSSTLEAKDKAKAELNNKAEKELKTESKEEPKDKVKEEPEQNPTEKEPVQETPVEETCAEEPAVSEESNEESAVEDTKDQLIENKITSENNSEQEVPVAEPVDYSSWSYTKLKAEYKSITGKTCKLKKEEVITFLQGHTSNA